MHPDGGGEGCQGWGMSDATWHVFSRANMHKHARETRVRNLSPEGRRKEEIRAGERMAPTAWHLNRGFPLCTLSSLRSFCFHKENLFHMAPSACMFSAVLLLLLQVLLPWHGHGLYRRAIPLLGRRWNVNTIKYRPGERPLANTKEVARMDTVLQCMSD